MHPFGVILKVESGLETHVMETLAPKVRVVDYLYHYTAAPAFLNMLHTNQLWLSHASYMNDPTEVEYGFRTIMEILDRSARCPNCLAILRRQREFHTELAVDTKSELAFVFSLTELDDHLSPWMEYADAGNGVCLEFANLKVLATLRPLIPANKHMYFPVQYFGPGVVPSPGNIADFPKILLDYFLDIEAYIAAENLSADYQLARSLYSMTKLVASFVKHDFHQNEKEWRFVLFAGRGSAEVNAVPSGRTAKMVFKLGFSPNWLLDIVDSVKVGPTHASDERLVAALEVAILKEQKRNYNVLHSRGITR